MESGIKHAGGQTKERSGERKSKITLGMALAPLNALLLRSDPELPEGPCKGSVISRATLEQVLDE